MKKLALDAVANMETQMNQIISGPAAIKAKKMHHLQTIALPIYAKLVTDHAPPGNEWVELQAKKAINRAKVFIKAIKDADLDNI